MENAALRQAEEEKMRIYKEAAAWENSKETGADTYKQKKGDGDESKFDPSKPIPNEFSDKYGLMAVSDFSENEQSLHNPPRASVKFGYKSAGVLYRSSHSLY